MQRATQTTIRSPHSNDSAFSTAPLLPETPAVPKPETFRLPKTGGDPYFGLTRSWYYKAEKDGLLNLIRLRQRGKLRGIVLVPYDEVARIVHQARDQEEIESRSSKEESM